MSDISSVWVAIQVLVNNAANDDRHDFADVTPEYWDERMAINLRHHFFAIQSVVPAMKPPKPAQSLISVLSPGKFLPFVKSPM